MRVHDLALVGGRVIDPESGFDAPANLAIDGGTITRITTEPVKARDTVDVRGLAVAPGWIDLHSHSHTVAGLRLQAMDGVTTALELEAGLADVDRAYRVAAEEGRPINYGFAASWAQVRMGVVLGLGQGGPEALLRHLGDPGWQGSASPRQVAMILELLSDQLAHGALGIGLLVGYAAGVAPAEYMSVSRLAARHGVPTFTHARDLVEHSPRTPIDGAEEVVRAAEATGVHAHYCHINSTSLREVDRVLALVARARAAGGRVSTEAYPYGAGMTTVSARFLQPEQLKNRALSPEAIVYVPTGERISGLKRLRDIQAKDPGGLAIVHFLEEASAADRAFVDRALLAPDTVIASDAMPLSWGAGAPHPLAWPLPAGTTTHPRTAGTFSKVFRRYVRELGSLSLVEAVRRCSLLPAQVLEESVPAMRKKGRLQVGCDADVVVFDPAAIGDEATYECSTRTSSGYAHVLVGGHVLVRDGELDLGSLPGLAVRRSA